MKEYRTYKLKVKSKINNIIELRMSKDLSTKKLSKLSGISEISIYQYETDARDLKKARFDTILALCDALKTTPTHLFKGDYGKSLGRVCRETYISYKK